VPLPVSRRGPRRERLFRLAAGPILVFGAVAALAWLAVPRRFAVDGVSMGPGLLPGDVVRTGPFPAVDRLRKPRRFDRWVLAAADGLAVKRVVGLPGEEVALVDGDLAIDGEIVLKSPRRLAELGSHVPDAAGDGLPAAGWAWARPAGEILDDAAFDGEATRVLSAVCDVGFAAVMDVRKASAADPAEIRVRVGDVVVARPLTEPGRHAVVAGRLDGRLVVSAWRMPDGSGSTEVRDCLPAGAPEAWQVADAWLGPADDDSAPALAIDGGDRAIVVTGSRWRDVAWRPGADGRSRWRLGATEVFVLGDHPPASTDSRRWGPISAAALRHRVVARAGR
jgi:type IV secretory pathway protease TraF